MLLDEATITTYMPGRGGIHRFDVAEGAFLFDNEGLLAWVDSLSYPASGACSTMLAFALVGCLFLANWRPLLCRSDAAGAGAVRHAVPAQPR